MILDKKLQDRDYMVMCGWSKIVSYLKKQLDAWAVEEFTKNDFKDFKTTYMPIVMNIDAEGINNNELAKRAMVTKQAMSKMIKELQEGGYISARTCTTDKRITIYTLTKRGHKFVEVARNCVRELMNEYRVLLGAREFDSVLDKLVKIIYYNNQRAEGK